MGTVKKTTMADAENCAVTNAPKTSDPAIWDELSAEWCEYEEVNQPYMNHWDSWRCRIAPYAMAMTGPLPHRPLSGFLDAVEDWVADRVWAQMWRINASLWSIHHHARRIHDKAFSKVVRQRQKAWAMERQARESEQDGWPDGVQVLASDEAVAEIARAEAEGTTEDGMAAREAQWDGIERRIAAAASVGLCLSVGTRRHRP